MRMRERGAPDPPGASNGAWPGFGDWAAWVGGDADEAERRVRLLATAWVLRREADRFGETAFRSADAAERERAGRLAGLLRRAAEERHAEAVRLADAAEERRRVRNPSPGADDRTRPRTWDEERSRRIEAVAARAAAAIRLTPPPSP